MFLCDTNIPCQIYRLVEPKVNAFPHIVFARGKRADCLATSEKARIIYYHACKQRYLINEPMLKNPSCSRRTSSFTVSKPDGPCAEHLISNLKSRVPFPIKEAAGRTTKQHPQGFTCSSHSKRDASMDSSISSASDLTFLNQPYRPVYSPFAAAKPVLVHQ